MISLSIEELEVLIANQKPKLSHLKETPVELLISRCEKQLKLLEGVKHFERLIERRHEELNGFLGTFTHHRPRLEHKIVIYQMCIERLYKAYLKLL